MPIDPGSTPVVGDLVEVEHNGKWQPARLTRVTETHVEGIVVDYAGKDRRIGFIYSIDSYRVNWRWR